MKIAIVRLSSLGDIIFCAASLQLIRRHHPDAEITWVADSRFADILDHSPDLQRIVKLGLKGLKKNFSLASLRAELGKLSGLGPFDCVIDMHGMIKSALVARRLGGRVVGFRRGVAKEPLATLAYGETVAMPAEVIGVRRYARLAGAALGFAVDDAELAGHAPFLAVADEDRAVVEPFFVQGSRNVVMVAGTSIAYKDYPEERLAEVARRLDLPVLICHGSDREEAAARRIAATAPNARLLPRLTLNRLKAAIGRADLVIGGDTGPTHIAWAMNIPSLTLFGATPADCIVPTERNRFITVGGRPNYGKPDPTDLSIREIPTDRVLTEALALLGITDKGE